MKNSNFLPVLIILFVLFAFDSCQHKETKQKLSPEEAASKVAHAVSVSFKTNGTDVTWHSAAVLQAEMLETHYSSAPTLEDLIAIENHLDNPQEKHIYWDAQVLNLKQISLVAQAIVDLHKSNDAVPSVAQVEDVVKAAIMLNDAEVEDIIMIAEMHGPEIYLGLVKKIMGKAEHLRDAHYSGNSNSLAIGTKKRN